MLQQILAGLIGKSVVEQARQKALEVAKAELIKSRMNAVREMMLTHVAEKYAEEVTHNISAYVQSIEAMEASVEFEGKPGQAFILKAQSAFQGLEGWLDSQNEDGPIITFLKKRYKEEDIRIITGRLYAGHYVNKKGMGTYEVANKMGYATAVDKRKPWLSSLTTTQGIEDIIKSQATDFFESAFDGIDLSSELATLKLPIAPKKKSGKGFGKS